MKEIAFKKVSQVMRAPSLVFSSTDTVSEFLGSLHRLGSYEAVVVFRNKLGLVTAIDVLDALHPERTLLGRVARSVSPLNRDATVLEAVSSMISNRVRAIPIVEDREVIGIVSCVEVMNAMMKSPTFREVVCEEVMKLSTASVNVNDKVSTARSIMYEHDMSNLPVIDEKRQLKGIITARDIVFVFIQLEESMTRGEFTGESTRIWDLPVRNLMDVHLLTAKGRDSLMSLIRNFRKFKKEVCIVKRYKRTFGIVTPMEIITLLLDFRVEEVVHVRILGFSEFDDFLDITTIQDKVARVLKRGVTFRDDIMEVIIDIKRRKRAGKRAFYQVKAKVRSFNNPLINVTAYGWYLAEAFDDLCNKLDRRIRKSKERRPRRRR